MCYKNVFAVCKFPFLIQPYITNVSCTGPHSKARYELDSKVVSTNGSCTSGKCTVNTTIMLDASDSWESSYYGSLYLTCTEHGWLPPHPEHRTCQEGKSKITSNFSFYTCLSVILSMGGECIPACNWVGGVYASMQLGRGCMSQHTMGQEVCDRGV